MNELEQRVFVKFSRLTSQVVEYTMGGAHNALLIAGHQVLAARACIGLGLLPPAVTSHPFERAVRLEVPATGDRLATQERDLRQLLAFAAREIILTVAAQPDAPKGLYEYDWRHYPYDYRPGGLAVLRPLNHGVEALGWGELPPCSWWASPFAFLFPSATGRLRMADFLWCAALARLARGLGRRGTHGGALVRSALPPPQPPRGTVSEYIRYECGGLYIPANFHTLPVPEKQATLTVALSDLWESVKDRVRCGTPDQIEDFYEHLAQVARQWLPGTDYLMLDTDIARLLPHCADPTWIAPLCVGPASGMYESTERIEGVGVLLKNRRGLYGSAQNVYHDPEVVVTQVRQGPLDEREKKP